LNLVAAVTTTNSLALTTGLKNGLETVQIIFRRLRLILILIQDLILLVQSFWAFLV